MTHKLKLANYLTACPQNWQRFVREINVNGDRAGEHEVDRVLKTVYNAKLHEKSNCVVFEKPSRLSDLDTALRR